MGTFVRPSTTWLSQSNEKMDVIRIQRLEECKLYVLQHRKPTENFTDIVKKSKRFTENFPIEKERMKE